MNKKAQSMSAWTSSVGSRGTGSFFSKMGTAGRILLAIIGLLIAIGIIWGAVYLSQTEWAKNVGQPLSKTPVLYSNWIGKTVSTILGIIPTNLYVETIILHLAMFIIIMFTFAEVIAMFTSFSETTSWVIGLCFAVIAAITGVYTWLATVMGFLVGVSALGVAILLLGGIAAAVTLNLGVGGAVRRWRFERQQEINMYKSHEGRGSLVEGAKAMKQLGEELRKKSNP